MAYIRQEIHGTTPQDLMKINENTMNIWEKVHGDIDFADTNKDMQNKVMTQWIPIQGEGNLDSKYPLYIRFYVPPNVKEISSSSFNMICENYRMDSSVTSGGGGVAGGSINLSIQGGGGGSTSVSTASQTSLVKKWGWLQSSLEVEYLPPPYSLIYGDVMANGLEWKYGGYYSAKGNYSNFTLGAGVEKYYLGTEPQYVLDLIKLQHQHEIPAHSHNISFPPHSHSGEASISIPNHEHPLLPGIYVATEAPQNVFVEVNDNAVAKLTTAPLNDQDWTPFINIGAWNTIKISTTNFARVTLYGTLEVVIKATK